MPTGRSATRACRARGRRRPRETRAPPRPPRGAHPRSAPGPRAHLGRPYVTPGQGRVDLLLADRPEPQDPRRGGRAVDDRGLHADRARAAVHHQVPRGVHPGTDLGEHVRRPRRADPAEPVGAGGGHPARGIPDSRASASRQARATGWSGQRRATVSWPPVMKSPARSLRATITVSAPGQNAAAKRSARGWAGGPPRQCLRRPARGRSAGGRRGGPSPGTPAPPPRRPGRLRPARRRSRWAAPRARRPATRERPAATPVTTTPSSSTPSRRGRSTTESYGRRAAGRLHHPVRSKYRADREPQTRTKPQLAPETWIKSRPVGVETGPGASAAFACASSVTTFRGPTRPAPTRCRRGTAGP